MLGVIDLSLVQSLSELASQPEREQSHGSQASRLGHEKPLRTSQDG